MIALCKALRAPPAESPRAELPLALVAVGPSPADPPPAADPATAMGPPPAMQSLSERMLHQTTVAMNAMNAMSAEVTRPQRKKLRTAVTYISKLQDEIHEIPQHL